MSSNGSYFAMTLLKINVLGLCKEDYEASDAKRKIFSTSYREKEMCFLDRVQNGHYRMVWIEEFGAGSGSSLKIYGTHKEHTFVIKVNKSITDFLIIQNVT